jgi:hypothetical protein
MPAPAAPLAVAHAAPRPRGISLRRAAIYVALIVLPWLVVLAAGLYVIGRI